MNLREALAMALYMRYGRQHTTAEWADLSLADRTYWRRQAADVRGAVLTLERTAEIEHLRAIAERKNDAEGNK